VLEEDRRLLNLYQATMWVTSVHRTSERAHSRKPTVASSHPYAPLRECMGAYMDRMRPHTGVYGSACCEDSWQSVTGFAAQLPENLSCVAILGVALMSS
jgi:hypothetical protein